MPFKDLREFISALDKAGELRRVDGANWDLEIGTLAELNYEREGPAFLFDGITGYSKGYRILTNAADTLRRALLAVDLPMGLDSDAADQRYREKVASFKPVPPVKVKESALSPPSKLMGMEMAPLVLSTVSASLPARPCTRICSMPEVAMGPPRKFV